MPFIIDDLLAGAVAGKVFSDGGDSLKQFLRLPPSQRLYRLLWHDFGTATSMSKDEFYAFATDPELQSLTEGLIGGTRLPDEETRGLIATCIERRLHRVPADQRAALADEISALLVRGYPLATRDLSQQLANVTTKLDTQHGESMDAFAELQSGLSRLLHRGDPQADLAAALLAGPLAHAGKEEVAGQAQQLAADGDHAAAAQAFLDVADGLQDSGLFSVAETYRLQAADQLQAAGELAAAAELVESVITQQLDRESPEVWVTTGKLQALQPNGWLGDALSACANWPHEPWARARLREAVVADTGSNRQLRWLATLTQIGIVVGDARQVLADLPEELPALAPGARLYVELDRLDAVEEADGPQATDEKWPALEAWAATQTDPAVQGLCWQRRGYLLARRGDLAGTREAYRRAMAAWSRVERHGEQVADCLFSLQAAESHLGVWNIDIEVRPLAAAMRSPDRTAAGSARRLQERAASNRIAENYRQARREYVLAFASYRRAGSLQGVLHVASQLAELYTATSHRPEAIELFVTAGNGKQAAKVAESLPASQVSEVLGPRIPPWERIAVYHVLKVLSTEADTDLVTNIADQLLSDASVDPPSLREAELAQTAKVALAAVSLQLPDGKRDAGFNQLRHDLHSKLLISASQAAAEALFRATQIGELDARDDLTDCFLAEDPIPRVEPDQLAALISDRVDLRERIIQAANEGSVGATLVLLWGGVLGEPWTDMESLATKFTRGATALKTLTVEAVDAKVQTTQLQGANFAPGGLAARFANLSVKNAFVDRVLTVISNDAETELNRASAAAGLFNCADALTPEDRGRAWKMLTPISRGHYQSIVLGSAQPDLLSQVQLTTNAAGSLRAPAIELLGRLWTVGVDEAIDDLRTIVLDALRESNEDIRAAGVEVMGRVAELMDAPELRRMLSRETPKVRREIAVALGRNAPEEIEPQVPELARDPHKSMRWAVIDIAGETQDRTTLSLIASQDPDSYTRGLARLVIDRLNRS
jgi:tetratricopeptide (TPR) repeat protein